jgi:two-component system, OmpR family, response regulator
MQVLERNAHRGALPDPLGWTGRLAPGPDMRLLLVEDDVKLARALTRGLEREGYAIDVAGTGHDAVRQALEGGYDGVVLDVMLPGLDGFAVCRELRRSALTLPVLMLTARSDVSDRIRGLDAGADDYLVKPFDYGELLARLRALFRRGPAEERAEERAAVLEVGDLRIEPGARRVTRNGREIALTAREMAVLELLARNAGQVVSRAELLEQVWEEEYDGSQNVVDVYVGYVRKKLEGPADGQRLIRTVRGVGFVLEAA